MSIKIGPDNVCELASQKKINLSIKLLDETEVLIEGNKDSLKFLGELILAQSNSPDTGFAISPNGAGKAYFTKDSFGVYIHLLK